jgi:hypothetical protein
MKTMKAAVVAVAVLHNDVLPFYHKLDLPVRALLLRSTMHDVAPLNGAG